ncbi:MAG: substrate-binding domain-containing protein [Oscillospiraceae bacterium]|nr:substrate-binding domain-containing protein [Oscillospiraceae bacterium]MCL2278050.1 substrate-binding domain-containing protein [Oscillospiraceae bacterium]
MKSVVILLFAMTFLLSGCDDGDEYLAETPTPVPPFIEVEPPREVEYFSFTPNNMPRIAGSPAAQPLAEAVASVLLGEPRETAIEPVRFTRTTQAFRSLAAGEADILLVSEPSPGVLDELRLQGIDTIMTPIATEALVFIVCVSNPVYNLTSEQLVGIFTGEIINWQQLGGNDIPIIAFQRNEEAASQVLMEKLVMDWQQMMPAPMETYATDYDDELLITAIRGFDGSPGAIGYTLLHTAETIGMTDGFKILSVDGIHPDQITIMEGSYPFLNHYYAVIRADEPEDNPTRILFNWLLSDEGQALIDMEGYASILNSLDLEYDTPPLPEMMWGVSTDFSALTPHEPLHSNFAGFMSASRSSLVPSTGYGMLLPYAGAATLHDGSMQIARYGLVTADGLVITNLIYDNVIRAMYYSAAGLVPRPAYSLHTITSLYDAEYGFTSLQAVSALDGSWVTSFEFVSVVFSDEVIFLLREFDSFDIYVIDYDGQFLYNMLDLDWVGRISEDTWPTLLIYSVSEGFVFVELDDGTFGLMDVSTGRLRETEFYGALRFTEGFAAVLTDTEYGLWGFVNTELEMVIEPIFTEPAGFRNGRAAVITEDGEEHIIDTSGEFLFTVSDGYMIILNHDATGFSVFSKDTWEIQWFFTNDFVAIVYPADATLLGDESVITFIGGGWFTVLAEEGTWLFNGEVEFLLPENRYVVEVIGDYIIFSESGPYFGDESLGVMSVDGRDLVAPSAALSITPVSYNGVVKAFILNSNTLSPHFIQADYTPAVYKLFDSSGSLLKSDLGVLMHDEALGLLYAVGTNYFAWLDLTGNVLLSIPSMGHTFD